MSKFVIVVGGVYSGTGKGISAASIGLLLSMRGLRVTPIKLDPYLNTNAGILRPSEHGESFVCDDGSETDLDLGHYERIIGCPVSSRNICTSGTLYKELIDQQEEGRFLGQTVQIHPHVTDMIQKRFLELGKDSDVVIAEIGGTVGDVESGAFFLAARQFQLKHSADVLIMLVSPIIWNNTIGEFKTKPLQQSVASLQSFGLTPDILLCRTDRSLPTKILDKVANLTGVPRCAVFEAPDVSTIYQVPLEFYDRNIDDLIIDRLHFPRNGVRIHKYRELVERYVDAKELPEVVVGVLGKYHNCNEAYLSLKEAIYHAGVANNVRTKIQWIPADDLEQAKDIRGVAKYFEEVDALIVPGGFDKRGVEGKIRGIRYVRERKVPFLGICLGLQCAVIEFARNACHLDGANSLEFDKATPHPVIYFVEGQEDIQKKSGTMRLGAYECDLTKDSLAHETYKKKLISERHRHRYEVNAGYVDRLGKAGFLVSGSHPQSGLVEIMELDRAQHPYFLGTQSHPEFKSRLTSPAPLFSGLIAAALKHRKGQ